MDGDNAVECDVCGGGHETEVCPELGLGDATTETSYLSKARLTIPSNLEVQLSANGAIVSVLTKETLAPKTKFGPFEARRTTHEIENEDLFVLKILSKEKDGNSITLDTSDENECNWMCLVQVAGTEEEQNCIAYQLATNIFYNTTKTVEEGTALKVWYAPHYAKKMGKSQHPDSLTRSMLGETLRLKDLTVPAPEPSPSPRRERPVRTRVIPAQQKGSKQRTDAAPDEAIESFFSEVKQSIGENEEEEDGHMESGLYMYKCQRCTKSFEDQSQLAFHIREHIMPTVQKKRSKGLYTCKICKVSFQTVSNYNRHMKRHVGFKVKCPHCDYSTYRPDILQTHLMGQHGVSMDEAKTLALNAEIPSKGNADTNEVGGPGRRGRRKKRGRKRKVEISFDELDDEDEDMEEPVVMDDDEDEEMMEEEMADDKKEESDSTQEKKYSETTAFSPTRIQPRRSLKGIRTTGALKGINPTSLFKRRRNESESEEEVSPVKPVVVEEGKKKRGRPRKNPVMEIPKKRGRPRMVVDVDVVELEEGEEEEESAEPGEIVENMDEGEAEEEEEKSTAGKEPTDKKEESVESESTTEPVTQPATEVEKEAEIKKDEKEDDSTEAIPPSQTDKIEEEALDDTKTKEEEVKDEDEEEEKEVKGEAEEEEEPPPKKRRGRPPKLGRYGRVTEIDKRIRRVGNTFQCVVCDKKFTQKKYLLLHLPKHSNKFKCNGCDRKFARRESYVNHNCVNHSVSDDVISTDKNGCYSCGKCGKVFSKPEYVKRHYSVHTSSWNCEKCNKTFSRRHLLLDHVCQKDDGGEIHDNHECEICKQCFRSLKYLYRHMAMHTDIFKCQGCDKTFSRKDSLQRHVLRCRPDLADEYKIYDCKNCKKTFATKLGLENHYLNCANYSCEKCRVAFFQIEHLQKHVCEGTLVHDGASVQFPCQECGKTFASINYLRRHEESHKGAFSCTYCEKAFSRKEELKLHEHLCYAQHFLEANEEVSCSLCNATFTDPKAYRDHHHEHSHPFKCEKCCKRFIKIGTLTTHACQEVNVNEENPYQCDLCLKNFRTDKCLQRHMSIHDKPQYECEYCHKVFFRKDYLNNHVCRLPDGSVVRIVRKKDRIFIKENLVCHLCGRTFVSSSNLNKHMKIHGEKQNECPHCGKKFHYPTYLREHIKTVHQRAYQFQCSDCGKILHSKTGLAAHLKQFHSNQIQLYQCGTCQKTFRQKGNLKTHMYSHTKEKTFMCDFCNKLFKYPDQLNRHRLEHTMTDKLSCEYCDKKFCRPYQLKKHVQTFHSGVVYVCDICNERCSHKHTIVRHYKRKHPQVSSVFDDQPDYLNSLQQDHSDGQIDMKPSISSIVQAIDQVETTVVTTDVGDGEQQYTVAEIQTDGEGYLPQAAAEALQNLSNTIIASEGEVGTLTIPHSIEGPDGQQTVVILQIVNPEDEDAIQEIQEVQEVQEIQEIQ